MPAASATGVNGGSYQNVPTYSVSGFSPVDANTAISFNGTNEYLSTSVQIAAPDVFSLELWYRVSDTGRGYLAGFEDQATGASARRTWMRTPRIITPGILFTTRSRFSSEMST